MQNMGRVLIVAKKADASAFLLGFGENLSGDDDRWAKAIQGNVDLKSYAIDGQLTSIILSKNTKCDIVTATSVEEVNIVVSESLLTNNRFKLAIVDVEPGDKSGIELMMKLREILGDINVIAVIREEDKETARLLQVFNPDDVIIREVYRDAPTEFYQPQKETLVAKVREWIAPRRISIDPVSVQKKRWEFARGMRGITAMIPLSEQILSGPKGVVEKLVLTRKEDGRWAFFTIYPDPDGPPGSIILAFPTLHSNCPIRCRCCNMAAGDCGGLDDELVVFSEEEMEALLWVASSRPRFKSAMVSRGKKKITLMFLGKGEGLVFNLRNCISFVRRVTGQVGRLIKFMMSSVGSVIALETYIRDCLGVSLQHSFSLIYPFEDMRAEYMKGTKGQPIKRLIELYGDGIAEPTGEPVIVALPVFPGLNDQMKHAREIYRLFKGRWHQFRFVLMAGYGMAGVRNASEADVLAYQAKLKMAGVPGNLIGRRETFAEYENASLGRTISEGEAARRRSIKQ